jgi:pyruvate formate lyase activating enzyme
MAAQTGILFDIKRFALHDGPGIRTTVFFKGCPLRCKWCQNPEGLTRAPQRVMEPDRCLVDCFACIEACPDRNLSRSSSKAGVERAGALCSDCGTCAKVCPGDAIREMGRSYTVEEVMKELQGEQVFHEESGGGVTFSGGEPLDQPDFLLALLAQCREAGMHTAVDTSGFAPEAVIRSVAKEADLFLYDLKVFDEGLHREFTGQSNRGILKNLILLNGLAREVQVRVPLVPGMTDWEGEISGIADFLSRLDPVPGLSLLPYHRFYVNKQKKLGLPDAMQGMDPPAEEQVEQIRQRYEAAGLQVSVRN